MGTKGMHGLWGMQRKDVIAAAESLRQRGERISVRTVRAFLGGGSIKNITEYLREWFKEQNEVPKYLDIRGRPTIERFMEKVEIIPHGCWEWRAYKDPHGYGAFGFGERNDVVRAHRFSYEHYVGPIPEGLQLDHLCRNRACVNPKHLEPVTNRENGLRGISRAAQQARQTHCIHGHPFDEANTRMRGNHRVCRKCHAASVNAAKKRKRAARDQAQPAEG